MHAGSGGPMYEAFGAYVRSQRQLARLTLRQAAELARISNPYLSQIEHGLALPSVTVLRALADALEVSTDTLLLRAAGVSTDEDAQTSVTEDAIRHDPRLDDAQRQALLAVLAAFVAASPVSADGPPASSTKPSSTKPSSTKPSSTKPSSTKPSSTKPSSTRPSPSTDREVTDHA